MWLANLDETYIILTFVANFLNDSEKIANVFEMRIPGTVRDIPLRHVFGPVPSRRLGRSLGVDLVPHKTCSLNCVYCECGDTTRLTLKRGEYVSVAEIEAELEQVLADAPPLDYITYSGSGEPTLNSGIGELTKWIKSRYPQYKLCLITNGTLLGDDQLIQELQGLDLVIPSFDASLDADFETINRHAPGLDVATMVEGMVKFRQLCPTEFWLEIFVVPGVNDSPESLAAFAAAVAKIHPDKVQLNTLDRPGCVDWIRPATPSELEPFFQALGAIVPVEAVGRAKAVGGGAAVSDGEASARALALIQRRPCTIEDLTQTLNLPVDVVSRLMQGLISTNKAVAEKKSRGLFFRGVEN